MHSRGESEMHGADLFGVAAALAAAGGAQRWCGIRAYDQVHITTRAARAKSLASLKIRSRKG
ncbi:hypothetical protein EBR66_01070 [bacterium]|nr:hypothetical protein [bacterium]